MAGGLSSSFLAATAMPASPMPASAAMAAGGMLALPPAVPISAASWCSIGNIGMLATG